MTKLSIIIATRNRQKIFLESLGYAVDSIAGYPAEIIVVNDGDENISNPFPSNGRIKFIKNKGKGVSCARNLGAYHAKGEVLFFIDDDMWINSEVIDWIDKNLIREKKTNAVYNINWEYPPDLVNKLKNNKIGRYILSSNYHTAWGRMQNKGKTPSKGIFKVEVVVSCSLVVPKEVFVNVGGYNEKISFQGEDIDLSIRLKDSHITVYAFFGITLFHNHADRLDLKGHLARAGNGYHSQFLAEKQKLIPISSNSYKKAYLFLLNVSHFFEKGWVLLYRLVPNHKIFDPISNKIIGYLGGLEKFKQWKKAFSKTL